MNVSTKQQRIAELAKQQPEMSFTSLNHYLDVDWLRQGATVEAGGGLADVVRYLSLGACPSSGSG